jgi:hypothetical protein
MPRKRSGPLAALLAVLALLLGMQAGAVTGKTPKILEFDTMVGVQGKFLRGETPIRGVNGAGAAWTLTAANGELSTSGHLELKVDGLVLTSSGNNPVGSFGATVSCFDIDGMAVNLRTAAFPATTGLASEGGGDASFEGDVALPDPCIAPIVYVTSPTGAWFASTGG